MDPNTSDNLDEITHYLANIRPGIPKDQLESAALAAAISVAANVLRSDRFYWDEVVDPDNDDWPP